MSVLAVVVVDGTFLQASRSSPLAYEALPCPDDAVACASRWGLHDGAAVVTAKTASRDVAQDEPRDDAGAQDSHHNLMLRAYYDENPCLADHREAFSGPEDAYRDAFRQADDAAEQHEALERALRVPSDKAPSFLIHRDHRLRNGRPYASDDAAASGAVVDAVVEVAATD